MPARLPKGLPTTEKFRRARVVAVEMVERPAITVLPHDRLRVEKQGVWVVSMAVPSTEVFKTALRAPVSYECDGATIFSILRGLLSKWDATNASIVHDLIYGGEDDDLGGLVEMFYNFAPVISPSLLTQRQGDEIFRLVLLQNRPLRQGVGLITAVWYRLRWQWWRCKCRIGWLMLRLLGWAAWNKARHGGVWHFRKASVKFR